MDHIDAKVFALITGGTTAAVGILKKLFPAWVNGKEEAIAAILPVLFVVVTKLCSGFKDTGWVDALAFAIGGGLLSGVAHDKLVNPVIKGLTTKKE